MPCYKPPAGTKPLDLRSAFLKVKWAEKQLTDLGDARVSFLGANPYYGVPKFNRETNRTQFILESVPDIPPEISLLLGDAVHNLRTALDHLACELVRSTGVSEPKVYFPICESENAYKAESDGKTKGMPPEAKKLIDRLCPYDGGNYLLWGLHRLDIIAISPSRPSSQRPPDSHRLLPHSLR